MNCTATHPLDAAIHADIASDWLDALVLLVDTWTTARKPGLTLCDHVALLQLFRSTGAVVVGCERSADQWGTFLPPEGLLDADQADAYRRLFRVGILDPSEFHQAMAELSTAFITSKGTAR